MHIWESRKNGRMNLFERLRNRGTDIENKCMATKAGRRGWNGFGD